MKKKDITDLKMKPEGELAKLLSENRAKLHSMKMELVAGKLKNTHEIREVRRTIARILTFVTVAQHQGETQK